MATKRKRRRKKKKNLFVRIFQAISNHLSVLGFTNRMGLALIILLALGLAGGFYLANRSISNSYTGALACYTVCFTPIGTGISVVLSRIVDKSKAENTGADGEGIVYAQAKATNFSTTNTDAGSDESPAI